MYFIIYRSDNPKGKFVVFTSPTHAVFILTVKQRPALIWLIEKVA